MESLEISLLTPLASLPDQQKRLDDYKSLALIGDGYFHLFARIWIHSAGLPIRLSQKLASGKFQFYILKTLQGEFSQADQDFIKRARNFKGWGKVLGQKGEITLGASSFEALLGKWVLEEQNHKLKELQEKLFKFFLDLSQNKCPEVLKG